MCGDLSLSTAPSRADVPVLFGVVGQADLIMTIVDELCEAHGGVDCASPRYARWTKL